MDVPSANLRSALAQSPGTMPGDRGRGGALLFGYFLLGKQEKVTRAHGCARNTTRTWGGFRETPKIKSKDKGRSWIPAFAGMTRWKVFAGMTR